MPRFYFHLPESGGDLDTEGAEFADRAAARAAAIEFAGEVIADPPGVLWDGQNFRLRVTDERGDLLVTVTAQVIDAPAEMQPG